MPQGIAEGWKAEFKGDYKVRMPIPILQHNNMLLFNEWEGRKGKYLARGRAVESESSEVCGLIQRTKNVPLWSDLSESISIYHTTSFYA